MNRDIKSVLMNVDDFNELVKFSIISVHNSLYNISKCSDSDWLEIHTPFLDRSNDYISVYIKIVVGDDVVISDDGDAIQDLIMSGRYEDKKDRIDKILASYNINAEIEDDEIIVKTNLEKLHKTIFNFIAALHLINNL